MVYISNQRSDIMKIDTRAEDVVSVTIGDWTIYIDNSTGEKIVEQWNETDTQEDYLFCSLAEYRAWQKKRLLGKGVST